MMKERIRQLLTLVVVAAFAFTFVRAIMATSGGRRWLMVGVGTLVVVFFAVRALAPEYTEEVYMGYGMVATVLMFIGAALYGTWYWWVGGGMFVLILLRFSLVGVPSPGQ